MAVTVVVAHGDAVAAVHIAEAPRRALIGEGPITVVDEQPIRGGSTADPEDVHPPVVVKVADAQAAGHPLLGPGEAQLVRLMGRRQTGLGGPVGELHLTGGRPHGDRHPDRRHEDPEPPMRSIPPHDPTSTSPGATSVPQPSEVARKYLGLMDA